MIRVYFLIFQETHQELDEHDQLLQDWEQLLTLGEVEDGLDLEDYINIDDTLATGQLFFNFVISNHLAELPTIEEVTKEIAARRNTTTASTSQDKDSLDEIKTLIEGHFANFGIKIQEICNKIGL